MCSKKFIAKNNVIGKILLICISITIFIVSFLISYKTQLNSHPDEDAHYKAVEYYKNHNMPPKFTSDEIIDSFSKYGESRLTELDIYYFLAGKWSNILQLFSRNEVFNARSFNLLLLLIVLIMCFKLYKHKSLLFMPFLLSSQLWYIFSYINNDAWAIFLNLLLVYQLFFKESTFNKLIQTNINEIKANKVHYSIKFILLGILFGLLLLVKINYLLSTAISCIIYLIINHKMIFKKGKIFKISLILLIGCLLVCVRLGIDYAINGLDRINNMEQIRQSRATEDYLPPYEDGKTYYGFKLSERGKPITDVIKNEKFYKLIINSFIGLFGYMNKPASDLCYHIVYISYILLIMYFAFYDIIKKIKEKREKKNQEQNQYKNGLIPLILVILTFLLLLALVIYRSYTYDYQPQGRYLLPIIPLICSLMYNKKNNKIEYFFFLVAIILIYMYVKYGYLKLI